MAMMMTATNSFLVLLAVLASLLLQGPPCDGKLFSSSSLQPSTSDNENNLMRVTLGAILPKTSLITKRRQYHKRLTDSVESLIRSRKNFKFNFTNYYFIQAAQVINFPLDPQPTAILNGICEQMLVQNVSTILYMTNSDIWGGNAAPAQYLLQLTNFLGIPVIAWNADNIGLDQHQNANSRILQLAPSMEHQASAMLSILRRYSWNTFSIVTSRIGGYDHFIRALRDQSLNINGFKFDIIDILSIEKTSNRSELLEIMKPLSQSEARVFLMYSNKLEAQAIFSAASMLGMTSKNHMWIVTQSVLGKGAGAAPGEFPSGMLGVHFNTTDERMLDELERGVTVFGHALELLVNNGTIMNLNSSLNCKGTDDLKWETGGRLFSSLRNVSIKSKYGRPSMEFNLDGTLKFVELDIVNLNNNAYWEKIGTWNQDGIDIKDITWPGNSPVPPLGLPEKFNLRAIFLEEAPFVNYVPPDNETGECKMSRSVPCRGVGDNRTSRGCCAGFCIDLFQKFAHDLKFTYDLSRVEDGAWGILNNNSWNGLIGEIISHKADIVVTSIKINSDRQEYVDFTVPFLETGIGIAVAKRTGIISPKAFLEPFDVVSWVMILLVSIQVAVFAIFLFEWLSPSGYDMEMRHPRDHKFSLLRTYWLVWAILFGAAVHVDCPKGYTARFMANTWATFAVVFLAIYTANLAAFMITREEYHDFTGIEDKKLANPTHSDPPLKFGTIPFGNTEQVLKRNKPRMFKYMLPFNRSKANEGMAAIKKGELDAFIYDAVVLDHLVGEDNECGLLTVGSWYAMTGYGFAMAKDSKYLEKFNKKMIEYRENGDLERLRRYWFQGACKSQKNKRNISKPLDVNQFMSAFLLLGCGILLTVVLLALEHLYFRYCRQCLARTEKDACFTLVSMSLARSLRFGHHNMEDTFICDNRHCEDRRQRTLKELEVANYKVHLLQKFNPEMVMYLKRQKNAGKKKDSLCSRLIHNQSNLVYSSEQADRIEDINSSETIPKRRLADFETIL